MVNRLEADPTHTRNLTQQSASAKERGALYTAGNDIKHRGESVNKKLEYQLLSQRPYEDEFRTFLSSVQATVQVE